MTLKPPAAQSMSNELRDQHTQKGADWTSALFSRSGVSVTVSASADCVPFGGRVSDTTRNEHTGGHDE